MSDPNDGIDIAEPARPACEGVAVTVIAGEFYLVVPRNGHLIGPMPMREVEDALDVIENKGH